MTTVFSASVDLVANQIGVIGFEFAVTDTTNLLFSVAVPNSGVSVDFTWGNDELNGSHGSPDNLLSLTTTLVVNIDPITHRVRLSFLAPTSGSYAASIDLASGAGTFGNIYLGVE